MTRPALGGTFALSAVQGEEIALWVATNGDIGISDPDARREDVALVCQQDEQASAAKLGIASVQFLGQPNAELQQAPCSWRSSLQGFGPGAPRAW